MEVAAQTRASLGNATEIGPGPDTPEWMNECYARYLELLDGVFRVAHPEGGEANRLRVYHSGCVSFQQPSSNALPAMTLSGLPAAKDNVSRYFDQA